MCRQFIREFCDVSKRSHLPNPWEIVFGLFWLTRIVQPNTPILMYDKLGKYTVMTLEQLLPMSFGPDKLLSTEELARSAAQ